MHATVLVYALILATKTIFSISDAHVLCTPCLNRLDCEEPPREVCVWGETRICGRRTCAKGPGEYCGGTFDVMGKCGEGMMCTAMFPDQYVTRCQGCSTFGDIQCYPPM